MSCSEQPAQSTCVWWYARKPMTALAGKASARRLNCSTSAIISSITKPR